MQRRMSHALSSWSFAAALAAALPGRFLVNLGGDIATNGAAAQGGWRIGIEDADDLIADFKQALDQV